MRYIEIRVFGFAIFIDVFYFIWDNPFLDTLKVVEIVTGNEFRGAKPV